MLSVSRKDFPSVERIVHSLNRERLGLAQRELELSGQTTDEGIKELVKSLSHYGFRQPISREHHLSLRHKIKSLIIQYGIPAIWFTLNEISVALRALDHENSRLSFLIFIG